LGYAERQVSQYFILEGVLAPRSLRCGKRGGPRLSRAL
jgi:hypothetical protein